MKATRPQPRDSAGLQAFIRANLPVSPVLTVPEIRLHQAGPTSGLGRLADGRPDTLPYWAYPWSGGLALARHFLGRPEVVAGRRVLDLGAGSGLVAIAAARAGAGEVIAAETDAMGLAAIQLNAALNGAAVAAVGEDVTKSPPPAVDLVAVGDLFYERGLALRVTAYLDHCLASGIEVLVGDPGRAFLPVSRLSRVAAYDVSGFGDARQPPFRTGYVFSLRKDSP